MTEVNDRLRTQLDGLLGQYDKMRRSMSTAHQRMREITGTAESADRLVRVTVGPRGTLTALELDPKAYRKLSPSQLAEAILQTAQRAAQDATSQQESVLAPLLPAGVPVAGLVSGEADPQTWGGLKDLTGATLDEWWSNLGDRRATGER